MHKKWENLVVTFPTPLLRGLQLSSLIQKQIQRTTEWEASRLVYMGIVFFPDIMARAAEKQFWGCPELVEGLLPFMDTLSIRRLVQVVII